MESFTKMITTSFTIYNFSKMTQAQWMRYVMCLNTTFGVEQPGPQCANTNRTPNYIVSATVNSPAHHEGWMVSGQETVFCWVPVP
jgi:hypothetical protein